MTTKEDGGLLFNCTVTEGAKSEHFLIWCVTTMINFLGIIHHSNFNLEKVF